MWKPIKSAPKKDRDHFLAAKFANGDLEWVKEARWFSGLEVANLVGGDPEDYPGNWIEAHNVHASIRPTHWMPLSRP